MAALDEQRPPRSLCPDCGSEPAADPRHRLSDIGYLHDDIPFECPNDDCERGEWTHGVPIGAYSREPAGDTGCPVCGGRGLVHRVLFEEERLQFKCDSLEPFDCPDCGDRVEGRVGDLVASSPDGAPFGCPSCSAALERGDFTACYYFWQAERPPDHNGVALVGYPEVAGEANEDTTPYGWSRD